MYDQFGASEVGTTRQVRFRLFVPEASLQTGNARPQYDRGGLPRIKNVYAVGNFQDQINGGTNWEPAPSTLMIGSPFTDNDGVTKGTLYEYTSPPLLTGFYEYKYWVEYENPLRTDHFITDPCTRYAGSKDQNGGFVIDGTPDFVVPTLGADRKPYGDLVVYELMIEDFTHEILQSGEAPLAAIARKLDYLQTLGVNAIEMMPWTAWPDDASFSWGYLPYLYFATAYRYTLGNDPTQKLIHLKELVAECHKRKMHVIMDGVFAHVELGDTNRKGFPYYWLYQDPADSPYVDSLGGSDYGKHLDYRNRCTVEFVRDACIYWIEQFGIDGIRFDETSGFFPTMGSGRGFAMLLSELRAYLSDHGIANFGLVLEDTWDYTAVGTTNDVGGTSCWFYPLFWECQGGLERRGLDKTLMRALNSGFDFQPGRVPTTFLENHDHRTLVVKAGGRDQWWRTQPYAIALFTCPGAILLHNGQEFSVYADFPEPLQDKKNQRVVRRPLVWEQASDGPGSATFALYQQLIALWHTHPGLHSLDFHPKQWDEDRTTFDADGFGVDMARQLVVFHRWGQSSEGILERFYVVLNFSQTDQDLTLHVAENGEWEELLSGWKPLVNSYRLSTRVGSNWGQIFYRKG